MVKKRSVFDIDFELEDSVTGGKDSNTGYGVSENLETKSFGTIQGHPLQNDNPAPARRGPMASAIVETAQANADRTKTEAAIRAENDALAHEHVRLKKLGLITDLIATDAIHVSKLIRDRSQTADPQLEELKESIKAIGLSNPVRVEQTQDGYELIQGFRRLSAFRELERETGDARYARIPASLVPRGEPLIDLYRKMVDENMVRKDLSFGEMAQLAVSYAQDEGVTRQEAVRDLYASALKQKRRYILQFTTLIEHLGQELKYVEAIPRALGLDLDRFLTGDGDGAEIILAALQKVPNRDAAMELDILRACVKGEESVKAKPTGGKPKTMSKTSLRLQRPEGEVRVIASDGRIDLRLDRDFSAINKEKLQASIEALLNSLE